jgi:hypothetical protein
MVLKKILNNALKYTYEGEVVVKTRDFDHVIFWYRSEIPAARHRSGKMAYLFDPYRRKMTGGQQYGGIGVGLALSRLYVEIDRVRFGLKVHLVRALLHFTLTCLPGTRTLLCAPHLNTPGHCKTAIRILNCQLENKVLILRLHWQLANSP